MLEMYGVDEEMQERMKTIEWKNISKLQSYCSKGNLEKLKKLYNSVPDLNISDDDEHAFRLASRKNHIHIMKQLLEWKPNIDISANSEEVLINCCHYGYSEMLLYLKEIKPTIKININNEYAFRTVAARGYLDIMKILYEWNSKINILAENNESFRQSIFYRRYDISKQLIEWEPLVLQDIQIYNLPCINEYLNIIGFDLPEIWYKKIIKRKVYTECSICLHSYKEYLETPCNHIFCQNCILKWIKINNKCPYCRRIINFTN